MEHVNLLSNEGVFQTLDAFWHAFQACLFIFVPKKYAKYKNYLLKPPLSLQSTHYRLTELFARSKLWYRFMHFPSFCIFLWKHVCWHHKFVCLGLAPHVWWVLLRVDLLSHTFNVWLSVERLMKEICGTTLCVASFHNLSSYLGGASVTWSPWGHRVCLCAMRRSKAVFFFLFFFFCRRMNNATMVRVVLMAERMMPRLRAILCGSFLTQPLRQLHFCLFGLFVCFCLFVVA